MTGKSKNPTYPDADPTAPGGMSRKALAEELVQVHGWTVESVREMYGPLDTWPQMIDAVVCGRRDRERERTSLSNDGVAPCIWCAEQHEGGPENCNDVGQLDAANIQRASLADNAQNILFIGMPATKDYIFDGHAGASPSGAERWMSCTASLGAARAFLETLTPNQQAEFAKSGTAARQGTTAHAAAEAEAMLRLGLIDDAECDAILMELCIIPDTEGEAFNDEMAEYISEYVDLVQSYIDEGREVHVEERVIATIELQTLDADGEYNLHDIPGSADLAVIPTPEHPVLVVGDLKYGEGLEVEVKENPQIRIYAIGVLARVVEKYGCLPDWLVDVEYVIAQPRRGGIKTWSEPVDALLDWQEAVLSPALTEALGGLKAGAAFNPSDVACQWCPARGTCPALVEQRIEAAAELFDVITDTEYQTGIEGAFPETESLNDADLGKYYAQIKALVSIADDLKAEVQRRLHRGGEVPGFHLVNYTPPRSWKAEAAEWLGDNGDEGVLPDAVAAQLWTQKLVSPTQAEKILGEDYAQIAELVVKPDIRPVAAPVNDRRKAWTGVPPEQMFDVEGEE